MRVAVVGTGVIGTSWARLFLDHGHDVVATDPAANTVTVGVAELLGIDAITGEHARWCGPAPEGLVQVGVQLRAHGAELPGQAWADGTRLHVRLAERTRGVAAGQAVVLYDGTRVIGSATIVETGRA